LAVSVFFFYDMFQYLYGAIEMVLRPVDPREDVQFQYLYGAIEIYNRLPIQPTMERSNTSMVRLKFLPTAPKYIL